eukprot:TRINITY_DN11673_c0_g1_i1.p1 TRINITY_DN11673_c0_g1~~TRINITY_DN11673_c0_g1_i1.p1  ORF type:complete len:730 (-),score=108.25 TRINITY_DN11673_c0_g1_i1:56-1936(-)
MELNTINTVITLANISDTLSSSGITLFAPDDEAFLRLNKGILGYLQTDDPLARSDLDLFSKYHLAEGTIYTPDFDPGVSTLQTLANEDLDLLKTSNTEIEINGNSKIIPPINGLVANGVIHAIDNVLIPPGLTFGLDKMLIGLGATVFLDLLNQTGILDTLIQNEPITLFAPPNNQLQDLNVTSDFDAVAELLLYHVLSEPLTSSQFVDGQVISTALPSYGRLDVPFQGLKMEVFRDAILSVYVTSDRILPRSKVTDGDFKTTQGSIVHQISLRLEPPQTIGNVLNRNPDQMRTFASLVANASRVMNETGEGDPLSHVLDTGNDITLFVPQEAALDDLRPGIMQYLRMTNDPKAADDLVDIVLNHAIDGLEYAYNLMVNQSYSFPTMGGGFVDVERQDDDSILVDGLVRVDFSDLLAANGVVHTLNGVLIPAGVTFSAHDLLVGMGTFKVLLSSLLSTEMEYIVTGMDTFTIFAPNDAAFARVKDLQAILDDTARLKTILQHHIINDSIANLEMGASYETANRANLTVLEDYGDGSYRLGLFVDDDDEEDGGEALVTLQTFGENGYIYVINSVLGAEMVDDDSSELEIWQIALIIIGAVLLVTVVSAILAFVLYRRQRRASYERLD